MYPYNYKMGQKIQTSVDGISADHAFLAHFKVLAAVAVAKSDVSVHEAIALTALVQEITTEITNPAVPRNITVKGNAADVVGDVVINGTNYSDEAISETIALNGATAVEGNKAFKTVTKIDLPVEVHAGTDAVSVGFGDKLGLPFLLTHNTVLQTFVDDTLEATVATVTTSPTAIESNTIALNTALSGKAVDAYLIV